MVHLGTGLAEETSRGTHEEVAELVREVDDASAVLDIPCGPGAFSARLLGWGYEPVAADAEPPHELERVGATVAAADMNEALPWPDCSFDAVVCIDGIEHIERPFDYVAECHRILRPDGALVVSTPNISSLRSRWRYLLTGFHNKGKTPLDETRPSSWHHIGLIAFDRLRYLLHRNSFEIDAVRTNRVKAVSWLYLPLVPVTWLATTLAFRKEEKNPAQRERNREIRRQLFSTPVLFGETTIVRARARKP